MSNMDILLHLREEKQKRLKGEPAIPKERQL